MNKQTYIYIYIYIYTLLHWHCHNMLSLLSFPFLLPRSLYVITRNITIKYCRLIYRGFLKWGILKILLKMYDLRVPPCEETTICIYPLVNVYIAMENHHAINGKINYFYGPFSIAMSQITGGYIPLKSTFCWLHPIKPPFSYGFPMVFHHQSCFT